MRHKKYCNRLKILFITDKAYLLLISDLLRIVSLMSQAILYEMSSPGAEPWPSFATLGRQLF